MRRRDFVKALMATSVAARSMFAQQSAAPAVAPSTPPPTPTAPGPVPWMRGLTEAKPLPMTPLVPDAVAETKVTFFSETQMATLRKLGDVMMPPLKGYPGAAAAGTPEFLDFLIGASPLDRQQMYQAGLDRLEKEAKQKFNVSFAAVDAAQADQLLKPWMRAWMTDHPPSEPYEHFINLAHSDIRTATVNSQAWSEAASRAGRETEDGLYWYPIDPDLRREAASQTRVMKRHA
jgi:hypothetical protein